MFYASFIVHSGKQAEFLYCALPLSPLPSLPILIHIWHSALCRSHYCGSDEQPLILGRI